MVDSDDTEVNLLPKDKKKQDQNNQNSSSGDSKNTTGETPQKDKGKLGQQKQKEDSKEDSDDTEVTLLPKTIKNDASSQSQNSLNQQKNQQINQEDYNKNEKGNNKINQEEKKQINPLQQQNNKTNQKLSVEKTLKVESDDINKFKNQQNKGIQESDNQAQDMENEYEQIEEAQEIIENDQIEMELYIEKLKQKNERFVPDDTLFVFTNNEFLYLDFKKDTWALGDVQYIDGSPAFVMPENSAIIPIDDKIHKCKHSNFLVSGGVLSNGLLVNWNFGVELEWKETFRMNQYQSNISIQDDSFNLPIQRMMHQACLVTNKENRTILLVIGGKVGKNLSTCVYTKSVLSFEMIFVFEPWERLRIDPESKLYNSWTSCAPMSVERACFSQIVIDNKVYVFGGISGNSKTKKNTHAPIISEPNTERYDPKLDKWEKIEIKDSPCLAAFSWSKINQSQILILGGTNGDIMEDSSWIIDFKEKKAIQQTGFLEFSTCQGIIVHREKENRVYSIGGFGSEGKNYQLKLEKNSKWEDLQRKHETIMPSLLNKISPELTNLNFIYFPNNNQQENKEGKQIKEKNQNDHQFVKEENKQNVEKQKVGSESNQMKEQKDQANLEQDYDNIVEEVKNDQNKIAETQKKLKEKKDIPNDVLFYFVDSEILYLDYIKNTWNLGDTEQEEAAFTIPECSSVILLDYESVKCDHSNIFVSGGVSQDGFLLDSLVGFKIEKELINSISQYYAEMSYFDKVQMPEKRMMHESCIIKIQGKPTLFVFGGKIGFSQSSSQFTNSVYSYDITTVLQPQLKNKIGTNEEQKGEYESGSQWKQCQQMASARACFSHIVIENKIYVFGGISGNQEGEYQIYPKISNPLTERYDPDHNKWDTIEISNSPKVAAFSWTKLGKNSCQIMILGGTDGDNSVNKCWIIDFKEQKAEEKQQLEQEVSMGKLIFREKDDTVYQIGGHGSAGQNFKLNLKNGQEWEEFERSQASILSASLSNQKVGNLVELACQTAIYFPYYDQEDK